MQQNSLTEHCPRCGSPNVYLVERPMSPWQVLAMVSRSLSLLSPVFSLSLRVNPRQRGQDQQFRCRRCNSTWHI